MYSFKNLVKINEKKCTQESKWEKDKSVHEPLSSLACPPTHWAHLQARMDLKPHKHRHTHSYIQ